MGRQRRAGWRKGRLCLGDSLRDHSGSGDKSKAHCWAAAFHRRPGCLMAELQAAPVWEQARPQAWEAEAEGPVCWGRRLPGRKCQEARRGSVLKH
jgi:hypothetical protein